MQDIIFILAIIHFLYSLAMCIVFYKLFDKMEAEYTGAKLTSKKRTGYIALAYYVMGLVVSGWAVNELGIALGVGV